MGALTTAPAGGRPGDKLRGRRLCGRLLLTALASMLALVMVVPFIWMLSTSFKLEADIFTFPIEWVPSRPTLSNYKVVWAGHYPFLQFYLNSIKIALFSVGGQVVVSSMAAYAFARLRFRGREPLFLLYLATMMIPTQVTLVPKYVLFSWMDILNTHLSVILPGMFSAFGVFILRQFFMGIPQEISEAAKIDGAGEFTIYARMILPLSANAVSSLTILAFVWCWNDYMTPLIFLRSPAKYTIPVALDLFLGESGGEYNLIMAAAVSAILPMVAVYFCCQKRFIESIAASALKG